MEQSRLQEDKKLVLDAIIEVKRLIKNAKHNERLRIAHYKGLNWLKDELLRLTQLELGMTPEPGLFSDQETSSA